MGERQVVRYGIEADSSRCGIGHERRHGTRMLDCRGGGGGDWIDEEDANRMRRRHHHHRWQRRSIARAATPSEDCVDVESDMPRPSRRSRYIIRSSRATRGSDPLCRETRGRVRPFCV
jgi:hypothetical protein